MDSVSTPLALTPRRGSPPRRQHFALLLAVLLAIACSPAAALSQEKPPTPEAALQRLKNGGFRTAQIGQAAKQFFKAYESADVQNLRNLLEHSVCLPAFSPPI